MILSRTRAFPVYEASKERRLDCARLTANLTYIPWQTVWGAQRQYWWVGQRLLITRLSRRC